MRNRMQAMSVDLDAHRKQAEKWREQGRDALLRWQVHAELERDDLLEQRAIRKKAGRRSLPWLVWIALETIAAFFLVDHPVANFWKGLLVALALPPLVMLCVEAMRALVDFDELQRRIELTALALTGMAAIIALVLLLMLQVLKLPAPPIWYVLLLGSPTHTIARRWAKRRYQ
jgi:hypothetical protein